MDAMDTIEWYFDFISPFAYLQSTRLDDFAQHALVRCRPVLFAAMLEHWGQKGPAEFAPKRRWTYEQVAWRATRHGVPLTFPPIHPFVPLRLLRLSTLLGNSSDVVQRLFRFVWRDGLLPTDEPAWQALLEEFGVTDEEVNAPPVKQALRESTQAAIQAGVFGVPTVRIAGELFWGFDSTDMVMGWLDRDEFFDSPLLAAARSVGQGVQRTKA
jgi:2-hydroxychromene-2-carboxylate isomerase